jgi:hypothetical protein
MKFIERSALETDFFIGEDLDLTGFCCLIGKTGDRFSRCRGKVNDILMGDAETYDDASRIPNTEILSKSLMTHMSVTRGMVGFEP